MTSAAGLQLMNSVLIYCLICHSRSLSLSLLSVLSISYHSDPCYLTNCTLHLSHFYHSLLLSSCSIWKSLLLSFLFFHVLFFCLFVFSPTGPQPPRLCLSLSFHHISSALHWKVEENKHTLSSCFHLLFENTVQV